MVVVLGFFVLHYSLGLELTLNNLKDGALHFLKMKKVFVRIRWKMFGASSI